MNSNNNFQIFQNSGYINNDKNRKKILVLDVDDSGDPDLGRTGEFRVELHEPLIIEKTSEIYLDNFMTYNANLASSMDLCAFSLKINEFDIKTKVASTRKIYDNVAPPNGPNVINSSAQHMSKSLIIPNEHKNPSQFHTLIIHKGKKFNYLCDINPGRIHSLSGKMTDLIGRPAFHDPNNGIFTYTIIGITPAGATRQLGPGGGPAPAQVVTQGEQFTGGANFQVGGAAGVAVAGGFTATIAVTTNLATTTELTFTTNQRIFDLSAANVPLDRDLFTTDITGMTAGGFDLGDNGGATDFINIPPNPGMMIIEGHGRFIAEFSIISRE